MMSTFKAKGIANDKVAPSFEHDNGEQSANEERPEEWKKAEQTNARPSMVRVTQPNASPSDLRKAQAVYRLSNVCRP